MSHQLFEELASNDSATRLKAAHNLITSLEAIEDNGEQLQYALRRLIRGLASGRKSSRIGFSLTLTELLSQLLSPNDSRLSQVGYGFDALLDMLASATKPESGTKGQDTRDHYLGRLFGLEALLTSVLQHGTISITDWDKLLRLLLELAKQKSWMQEQCLWALFSALPRCQLHLTQSIIAHVKETGLEKTPGGVAIYVASAEIHGSAILELSNWPHKDPLDPRSFLLMGKVMKEATMIDHDTEKNISQRVEKGSWISKLHFAWGIILRAVDQRSASGPSEGIFSGFWKIVVDNNLFGDNASDERKLWGFRLIPFALNLGLLNANIVVSGPKFLQCLVDQFSVANRTLHKGSKSTLTEVLDIVTNAQSSVGPAVMLDALLSSSCGPAFDSLTKSKTLDRLVSSADQSNWQGIINALHKSICLPRTTDAVGVETRRQFAADFLVSLGRKMHNKHNEEAVSAILDLLSRLGYSRLSSVDNGIQCQPPISAASQKMFREKVFLALSHTTSNELSQAIRWPLFALSRIHSIIKSGDTVVEFDSKVKKIEKNSMKLSKKMSQKIEIGGSEGATRLQAMLLLLLIQTFLLLEGENDSVSILEEIQEHIKTFLKAKDFTPFETSLTEILLSYLSKPSSFLKAVSLTVFEPFSSSVDEESVQSIIKILETKEDISGHNSIFDDENDLDSEGAMDIDDESDEGSLDSQFEVVLKDDLTSGSSSNDSNVSDIEADDNDKALDLALADLLGTRQSIEDPPNDKASDDDGSDMDDDQMMQLDGHLTKIFQERRKSVSQKAERKQAQALLVNFKLRLLDLIRVFFKKLPINPLVAEFICPLLELIRSTKEKQLSIKAAEVLRQLSAQWKKEKEQPLISDVERVWQILSYIHEEALRDASTIHANVCSSMSITVINLLVKLDRNNSEKIVDIYSETWKVWLLHKNCKVQPRFFSDFVNWSITAKKRVER